MKGTFLLLLAEENSYQVQLKKRLITCNKESKVTGFFSQAGTPPVTRSELGLRLRLPYVGHIVDRIALESFGGFVLWKFMIMVSL